MEATKEIPGRKRNKNHVILKFVLAFLVITLLTILAYQTDVAQFFLCKKRLVSFLESLGPGSFAGFILLQAFQVIAAPIPGDATGLLAATFTARGSEYSIPPSG